MGDQAAIAKAYPGTIRRFQLARYKQDSICQTWETLAKIIDPAQTLIYPAAGEAKRRWAQDIAPHMDVDANKSPSFQAFRDGVRRLVNSLSAA